MTSRARVTEYRPDCVTPLEEKALGQRLNTVWRSVRENVGIPLDVIKPNMVFEERDGIDREFLVNQHNVLAMSMCLSGWKA